MKTWLLYSRVLRELCCVTQYGHWQYGVGVKHPDAGVRLLEFKFWIIR